LLELIAGLVFPEQGQCSVLGHEPRKRKPSFMQQLYFVADEPYLPNNSTAQKLAAIYGPFYEKFDTPKFLNSPNEFHVAPNQNLDKLSFGQRKKAVIAFALAANTPLLLMDEPTNGLDIPSKSTFRKMVAGAMSEHRCIVISTHQVRDLDTLIDAVLVLHQGKMAYQEDLNAMAVLTEKQPNLEVLFQNVLLGV